MKNKSNNREEWKMVASYLWSINLRIKTIERERDKFLRIKVRNQSLKQKKCNLSMS